MRKIPPTSGLERLHARLCHLLAALHEGRQPLPALGLRFRTGRLPPLRELERSLDVSLCQRRASPFVFNRLIIPADASDHQVTAAVVESFSYVFYLPGKTSLSRQQLRAYKKAWAETDVDRTGRISRGQVGTLLYKLSGVLEVKIYPSELSVRNLVAFASAPAGAAAVVKGARACVNPRKLKDALCHFDYDLVKQRRQRFERLFREATLANDISFAAMLELLAHHVLIDDELALLLDELLPRRELADHIQQLIDVAKVESFLLATVCRRRRRRRLTLRASPDGLHSIVPEPTPPQEPGSSAALGASDNPL